MLAFLAQCSVVSKLSPDITLIAMFAVFNLEITEGVSAFSWLCKSNNPPNYRCDSTSFLSMEDILEFNDACNNLCANAMTLNPWLVRDFNISCKSSFW